MNPAQLAQSDQDSDTPAVQKAESGGSASMEDCVPMDALAMPDDKEQMQPPSVGDNVQYNVEGKVTRIEGNNAYVQKTAINGQKVEDNPTVPDEGADLEASANEMDQNGSYP